MYKDIDIKIAQVRGFSLSSPYGSGKNLGQQKGVKSIGFVEVITESGVKGLGETYAGVYSPELVGPVVQFLSGFVEGRLVGDEAIIQNLAEIPFIGRNGLLRSIASAIDIAIWDLRGKILGKPIYQLLTESSKNSVNVYASSGSATLSPEEIVKDVNSVLNDGHTAYKMRVGYQDWASDLKRVEVARKIMSDKDIMVDAIMGTLRPPWNAATAINRAKDLEMYNLRWIEEPVFPDNISELVEVRQGSKTPIAAGEAYSGWGEYQNVITAHAVDVLQFDATHSGGITACMSLANESKIHKLDSAVHVWGSAVAISANASISVGCPDISFLEIPMVHLDITQDMWIEAPSIKNGICRISDVPGLGVELSEDIKNKYKLVPGSGYRLP